MKWVPWAADSPLPGQCLRLDPDRNGTPTLDCVWLAGHGKGVSPNLTTLDLLISLIGYTVVYGSLAVAMVYLMRKYAVAGPDAAIHESVDAAGGISDVLPIGAQD